MAYCEDLKALLHLSRLIIQLYLLTQRHRHFLGIALIILSITVENERSINLNKYRYLRKIKPGFYIQNEPCFKFNTVNGFKVETNLFPAYF